MRLEDVRAFELFDGLTDEQLSDLVGAGEDVAIEPGIELFHEGDHADYWWVLVEGVVELVRRVGREDIVVGRMDMPGRWAGGFRAWDDDGVYLATGRGVTPGRLLRVPAQALRERSNRWFPFAGHLIEGLYRTARTIESTARQRDSLVTLGTLAAGLAHEINNPAAATTRSVTALEESTEGLLASLRALAQGQISADQFSALDALRQEAPPAGGGGRDALELADQEDELSTWLAAHGVDRDWVIAPALAAAGVDVAWCERVADAVGTDALGPGLEWVASTLSTAALIAEVKESTRRVSELVASVRSYSQLDRASLQRIDVTVGLESTLVMLGHKLRDVTVVRDYGSGVPPIDAYAGELNQVWTNLVDNAVDAMEDAGTLRVTTRYDGAGVVVEIGDTGPGMPEEVAARAFDAFYSTKDVGKGTGLGLDIARRVVVERHGGTIEIDTSSGETVLRVRLPVTQ
ncbi:MAG: ATP-binding protein [Marmoricola sp.]